MMPTVNGRAEDTKPREQDSMEITHWVVGSKTKQMTNDKQD